METLDQFKDKLTLTADGRPILRGCETLPPMPEDQPNVGPPQSAPTQTATKISSDRFETLNRFVDVTMRDLKPAEKVVWFVLFRDVRDGVVTVSQSDIARRSGIRQASVSTAIKGLLARGLVKIIRKGGFRKGMTSYRVQGGV